MLKFSQIQKNETKKRYSRAFETQHERADSKSNSIKRERGGRRRKKRKIKKKIKKEPNGIYCIGTFSVKRQPRRGGKTDEVLSKGYTIHSS